MMRNIILLFVVALMTFSTSAYSQSNNKSIEILYFKAKQCACKAKTCNALESDVKSVIDKNFSDKNIEFKRIWLKDTLNKALIEKFNAKPQTIVMVEKKRKKETITDLTEIVHNYSIKRNKEEFEVELQAKIAENLN